VRIVLLFARNSVEFIAVLLHLRHVQPGFTRHIGIHHQFLYRAHAHSMQRLVVAKKKRAKLNLCKVIPFENILLLAI